MVGEGPWRQELLIVSFFLPNRGDLPLLYHPTGELAGEGGSTTTVYYTTQADSKYDFEL